MEEDLLALTRRRRIFEHISKNPGTYLREMEGDLELSVGDLQYHLAQLEKGALVVSNDDGRRKGYFVTGQMPHFDRVLISLVRMRTPRRIILFLLQHPDSTFGQILAEFKFTKGALSFNMKRLVKSGAVLRGKLDRESVFRVADEEHMKNLLVTYQASIADEVLDGLVDTFTGI